MVKLLALLVCLLYVTAHVQTVHAQVCDSVPVSASDIYFRTCETCPWNLKTVVTVAIQVGGRICLYVGNAGNGSASLTNPKKIQLSIANWIAYYP